MKNRISRRVEVSCVLLCLFHQITFLPSIAEFLMKPLVRIVHSSLEVGMECEAATFTHKIITNSRGLFSC